MADGFVAVDALDETSNGGIFRRQNSLVGERSSHSKEALRLNETRILRIKFREKLFRFGFPFRIHVGG